MLSSFVQRLSKLSPRRRGFTTVELLVILVILLILLSIFIPKLHKSREMAARVQCANNLQAIGVALRNYATANDGLMPSVPADSGENFPGYFAFTGPFAESPFLRDGSVAVNDVTASLWLLVRGGYAKPDLFICPSSNDYADPMTGRDATPTPLTNRSNFKRARNLSYSYASPFSHAPGYKLDNFRGNVFVLLADKNPGRIKDSDVTEPSFDASAIELAKGNSLNHQRAGQNVLYAGIFVEFRANPYAGVGGDNIYTAVAERPLPADSQPDMTTRGVVGPNYAPAWKLDTYLVPTAGEDRNE